MKVAVISDIHSNLDALETVVSKLGNYDQLVCLGDVVGYGPQPNEVIETLHDLQPTVQLMGNHDYAVVSGDTTGFSENAAQAVKWTRERLSKGNLEQLRELKPSAKVEFDGTRVAFFHGSPRDPLTEYVFPGIPKNLAKGILNHAGTKLVVLGHTHMPMLYVFEDGLLANPGSVGQPRDGDPRASFGLLELTSEGFRFRFRRVEYDIDAVATKIEQSGLPKFLAERLYMGV